MLSLNLVSPIAEIFPEFGLSYFDIPNYGMSKYKKRKLINKYDSLFWIRLISTVSIWLIFAPYLYKLESKLTLISLGLVFVSLYIRFIKKDPLFGVLKYGYFYISGFLLAGYIKSLDQNVNINQIIISIIMIVIGSLSLGFGRNHNEKLDKFGRIMFSVGFTVFLKLFKK